MTARVEGGDLIQIYSVAGILTAEVLKGKLESVGIPVLLSYESLGPVMGLTVNGLGEVRILVPANFVEDARQVIFDLEENYVPDEEWS
ncbi:MAG: DUF2007 domain-containing protein [Chloroflexi bacterium]|nr:DUF2007 domain-containing protein [Chloroflexota bacterium]